jgi:DGQHR domain-containing protein
VLTLPALKVQQFSQEFYLLNVAAADVERLVRFEVLGDSGLEGKRPPRKSARASLVNWTDIEQHVQTSEKAYQRPILRKKIDELAQHYLQCRDDACVPAIPGAVLLTTEEPVEFSPQGANPFVGLVQLSESEGTLRVLDGQHRLLALAALLNSTELSDADRAVLRTLQVPAILFAGLSAPSVVEMFVTINSKHTRLNASLLFSLRGRQLYSDPLDARIHDTLKKLNHKEGSPLQGHVRLLGVGRGKVAQAGLAQEMRSTVRSLQAITPTPPWIDDYVDHLDRFYELYFREVAQVFTDAWESRKHSVRSAIALRAFIQVSGRVVQRVYEVGGNPRTVVRSLLEPWQERVGSGRFETAGAWRSKAAGGGKETTRLLARELVAALGEAAP